MECVRIICVNDLSHEINNGDLCYCEECYNEAIEKVDSLRKEVDELEEQVTNLENDKNEKDNDITKLENEIEDLEGKIEELTESQRKEK